MIDQFDTCNQCQKLFKQGAQACPFCQSASPLRSSAAVALLGLALQGCGLFTQELYGVVMSNVDADGDGFTFPADCDDGDPAIHPEANEVADDGIDSNCDGEDAPVS